MNIQNLQSPPDDRYNNYFINSKGNDTQISSIEKTNLFPIYNKIIFLNKIIYIK